MEEHSKKPLNGGHNIGGYDIVRVIGQGGFGIVYEAINRTTEERVAIKQFYPNAIATWKHGTIIVNHDDDRDLVARVLKRFEEEAALQFNFSHPNILRVKNFIRADNTGYMITDYVDGGSLLDVLKPYGSVFGDERAFRCTMEPILHALRYVHERGTLHRDISPDNIMVDGSGKPILVDFGAAKFDLQKSSSVNSVVQFREDYAPIEQQFPSADRREGYHTDIFAIAGTMYRVLSGKPPARAAARAVQARDPYVPVRSVAMTKCGDAIYAAIDRGLAMAPSARPVDVDDFLELLGWQERGTADRRGSAKIPLQVSGPAGSYSIPDAAQATDIHGSPGQAASAEPASSYGSPFRPNAGELHPAVGLLAVPPDAQPPPSPSRLAWRAYLWVFLILGCSVALLLVMSNPGPVRAPPPVAVNYRVHENTDLGGSEFPDPARPIDRQGCEAACNRQAGCLGYSYDKGEKQCHLKRQLTTRIFQARFTAAVRQDQPAPAALTTPKSIENIQQAISGSRYSTTTVSYRACSDLCEREDSCLGFQFVAGACWRYDRIDELIGQGASGGIKHQAPSR